MILERDIDDDLYAEFQKPMFHPCSLVYIDWPDDPVYAHSGRGIIRYNGRDYTGLEPVGSILLPSEAMGIVADDATLTLVGPIADLLGAANETDVIGSEVRIYAAATGTAGGNDLIGEPMRTFTGQVAKTDLDAKPEAPSVLSVRVLSGEPARASAKITHSDEDQQISYPRDTFFQRVRLASAWVGNLPTWPE